MNLKGVRPGGEGRAEDPMLARTPPQWGESLRQPWHWQAHVSHL